MEMDYEPELNIFGFISTDSVYSSFVSVHQTLNLNDPGHFTSYDTIWFGDGPYDFTIQSKWNNSYVVSNAFVTISHGNTVYPLFYAGSNYEKGGKKYLVFDTGLYIDTLNQFKPQPNEEYVLSVSTPDGRKVAGHVITPFIPQIKSSIIPDTLSITRGFSIEWIPNQEFPTLVWVYKMDGFTHYGSNTIDYGMLEANDTIWHSNYVSPLDYYGEVYKPDSVVIGDSGALRTPISV